jgi:hypothetical protein
VPKCLDKKRNWRGTGIRGTRRTRSGKEQAVVWLVERAVQDVTMRLTQCTEHEDQDQSKDMERHVVVLGGTGGATSRAFIMVVGLAA